MIVCEKCKSENPDRNYYCRWCGEVIKERVEDGKLYKYLAINRNGVVYGVGMQVE